jgi:hypothetical protein
MTGLISDVRLRNGRPVIKFQFSLKSNIQNDQFHSMKLGTQICQLSSQNMNFVSYPAEHDNITRNSDLTAM